MSQIVSMRAEPAALRRAMRLIDRVVMRRNTIPILGFVHVEATPERIAITGTDLDTELRIEVEGGGSGTTTLPCRTLLRLLDAGDGSEIPHGSRPTTPTTSSSSCR